MYSSLLFLGAFASAALAQAVTFSNTTFTAPVTVGSTWPISFSAGDGSPVALAFGNSTYAFQIVGKFPYSNMQNSSLPSSSNANISFPLHYHNTTNSSILTNCSSSTDGLIAPGIYTWTVAVPVNVVSGIYQLGLIQGNASPVFSPAFTLVIPDAASMSTTNAPTTSLSFPSVTTATTTATATTTVVTAIYLPQPTGMMGNMGMNGTAGSVTYIYYEEECGCHKTSSCDATAVPTSLSTTTVTYSASECGCTTTVKASCAPTTIAMTPAAAAMAATNTPMTPSVAPAVQTTSAAAMTAAPVAATSKKSSSKSESEGMSASVTSAMPAAYTGAAGSVKLAGSSFGVVALVAALLV